MSPQIIVEEEQVASTCYRAWTPPKPDPVSVEEAQRAFLAKAAARMEKRVGEGWGK